MSWLRSDELRVGLGCMRLPSDDEAATATIAAAVDSGITVFDTARAYGNERLVARAVRGVHGARVVTNGGMARTGGAWIPDGRARTIGADCEASLAALDGVPIDLYLLHAPDQRVAWKTTLRALAALVDDGLVLRVGVCNVNRTQLDVAVEHAPVSAVEVALSRFDDTAIRGGVVERCSEHGLALIAHSPLGGPRRVARVAKDESLREVARARDASEAEVALAWVLDLAPNVVAIPGAGRPETARSAARAAVLELSEPDRERLRVRPATRRRPRRQGDVVLVMGIQGAGKSRVARTYVERGYLRLNRDERGGTLRGIVAALDEALESDAREVVLDNTYLARARRHDVIEIAARHGLPIRCVWLDTTLAQAQVNLVERLLDRFDGLPSPEELKAASRKEAGMLTPAQQMRAMRELEPPGDDEGFASVQHIPFSREPRDGGKPGVFVAASAVERLRLDAIDEDAPHLVFDWRPDGITADLDPLAALIPAEIVEPAVCTHGGGPPICWCRPPLPGLPLAFARRHGVDPARSLLVGTSTAHRTLATALGSTFVDVGG